MTKKEFILQAMISMAANPEYAHVGNGEDIPYTFLDCEDIKNSAMELADYIEGEISFDDEEDD